MATSAVAEPLLDLDTIEARPTVRINKRDYPMRTADEFAYLAFRQQSQTLTRLGTLLTKTRLKPAEESEQARLMDKLCRVVLVAPDVVHKSLRDDQRLAIIQVFSTLLETSKFQERIKQATAQLGKRQATRTGARSRRV